MMLGHTRLKAKSQWIITLTRVKLLAHELGRTCLKAKKSIDNYTQSCKITRS